MKNDSLVIMAGGASSRMKNSLADAKLSTEVLAVAQRLHKSLIPLDHQGRPLLYYLFKNVIASGIKCIYLITSPENEAFKQFVNQVKKEKGFEKLKVKYAIQNVPSKRIKPLGTADALQQCLLQHKNLLEERFTVCNGDNLYSTETFIALRASRTPPHALIAYNGEGLGHSEQKIAKFALLNFTGDRLLTHIIEKPTPKELSTYKNQHATFWVSMNIFNFQGRSIHPFLEECPIHPIREEKELPQAVRNLVAKDPTSMLCIPRSERIPDLTSAKDIATFFT